MEQDQQPRQQPLAGHQVDGANSGQGGYPEAAQGDTEHEDRNHHGKGEVGGPERQPAQPDQRGLQRHGRKARQQGHHGEGPDRRHHRGGSRLGGCRNRVAPQSQQEEQQARSEIHHAHQTHRRFQAQPGNQEECRGERAHEGTGGVERVDECVEAGRIAHAPRQGLGENRDGAAHECRGRANEQRSKQHVHPETQGPGPARQPEGDGLSGLEGEGEEQGVEADRRFDYAVEPKQTRRPPGTSCPIHVPARNPSEKRVAQREPAQEHPQDGGSGLAVGSEKDREVLLPRHLVDETTEAGQQGEEQSDQPQHRESESSKGERVVAALRLRE